MHSTGPYNLGIRTEVRSDLGSLADKWDAIVDRQPLPSPFLRSWWVENATPEVPTIICVFSGDELIGGAAFEVASWGPTVLRIEKVRVAGAGLLAPDHIDLIAEPGHLEPVTRAVLTWLLRPGNRFIDLDGLAANGTLATLLEKNRISTFDAPFAELPADFNTYLAGRPGKVRSTIRRRSRQLSTQGVVHSTADMSEFDRAIGAFSDLHDMRWADESGFLDAFEPLERVLRAAADRGEAVINELRLGSGMTIAVEIDFRIGDRLFFYQAGRRTEREWRGSGTVLRSSIIEAAIAEGAVEYDMLRGDEPYKNEWATGRRQLSCHRMTVGRRAALALTLRSITTNLGERLRRTSR